MRIGEIVNECGTPVVKYRCDSCHETFTVCPAPTAAEDDQWKGCLQPNCPSYDPVRDADRLFDNDNVLSFERRFRNPVLKRSS